MRASRRKFLATALTAVAGCGRAVRSTSVVQGPSARRGVFYVNSFRATQDAIGIEGYRAAFDSNAAAAWFQPVLDAFNDSHSGRKAVFGNLLTPQGWSNPEVSAQVGGGWLGRDVSGVMKDVNFDQASLLDGVLNAVTTPGGAVPGLPVDFSVIGLHFDRTALAHARVAAPSVGGWTSEGFLEAVSALSALGGTERAVFGSDLAFPSGVGAFLGYTEGYGGAVYSGADVSLTTNAVLDGLDAYGNVLRRTWKGMSSGLPSGTEVRWSLTFRVLSWSAVGTPWPELAYTRFPIMPVVHAVPALLDIASVPTGAPDPESGAEFIVWLLSEAGQEALTSLGYPAMRKTLPPATWLEAQGTGITYPELRFPSVVMGMEGPSGLDYLVLGALSLPSSRQLEVLDAIESNLNRNGGLSSKTSVANWASAVVALGAAGVDVSGIRR